MLKISAFAPPNVVFCVHGKQKTIFVNSVSFDSGKNRWKLISYFLVLCYCCPKTHKFQKDKPVLTVLFNSLSFLYLSLIVSVQIAVIRDLPCMIFFLRKTSDADAGLFTKVNTYYELTRHSIISIVSPV